MRATAVILSPKTTKNLQFPVWKKFFRPLLAWIGFVQESLPALKKCKKEPLYYIKDDMTSMDAID